MITLRSSRLRVELPEPAERPNDRTRFERAGYISEVVLDGGVQFAASEPKGLFHPPTGGRGLCCEYRTDYSAQAAVGEYYPKFGVGLIRKTDEEPYRFYRRYEDVRPFPVQYRHTADRAEFVTEPIACMGYAMRTKKTIWVEGNRLVAEAMAENTGEKDIDIIEFCHNFISVDGMALGPDYHLELPTLGDFGRERMIGIDGRYCSLRGDGKGFSYCEYSARVSHITVDCGHMSAGDSFTWKIRNDIAKAYVLGTESFLPSDMEIWSIDHVVAPEAFQRVSLSPGESHRWTRTWTFDTL